MFVAGQCQLISLECLYLKHVLVYFDLFPPIIFLLTVLLILFLLFLLSSSSPSSSTFTAFKSSPFSLHSFSENVIMFELFLFVCSCVFLCFFTKKKKGWQSIAVRGVTKLEKGFDALNALKARKAGLHYPKPISNKSQEGKCDFLDSKLNIYL